MERNRTLITLVIETKATSRANPTNIALTLLDELAGGTASTIGLRTADGTDLQVTDGWLVSAEEDPSDQP